MLYNQAIIFTRGHQLVKLERKRRKLWLTLMKVEIEYSVIDILAKIK